MQARRIRTAHKYGNGRALRALWKSSFAGVPARERGETGMDGIIYLVGLVVVILAVLSFFGLR
jgi:hypothetical protein